MGSEAIVLVAGVSVPEMAAFVGAEEGAEVAGTEDAAEATEVATDEAAAELAGEACWLEALLAALLKIDRGDLG